MFSEYVSGFPYIQAWAGTFKPASPICKEAPKSLCASWILANQPRLLQELTCQELKLNDWAVAGRNYSNLHQKRNNRIENHEPVLTALVHNAPPG